MATMREIRRANLCLLLESWPTQKAFAEASGLAAGHVSQMVNGTREVGENVARRIESSRGLQSGWMDTPHDSTHHVAEPAGQYGPQVGSELLASVPVVGVAQLGDGGYWADLDFPTGHGDGYIPWPTKAPNAYALRCRGDSMKPRVKDGEYVIVEPSRAPIPGDEVLIKARDGRVMIKELLYVRDGTVHLLSVNEAHGKLALPLEQIEAMHYVAGIAKAPLHRMGRSEPA
jgi:hypothetical protein